MRLAIRGVWVICVCVMIPLGLVCLALMAAMEALEELGLLCEAYLYQESVGDEETGRRE